MKMPISTADVNGSNGHALGSAVPGSSLPNGSSVMLNGNGLSVNDVSTHLVSTHRTLDSKDTNQIPIAICGMSVRLPGGLHSPQDLWNFLIAKRDARGPVPKSRYDASSYHSKSGYPGTVKTEYGYFLDDSIDISNIDTSFFHMGKAEVERVDPHQRQMLEVARECMEDAGQTEWKGRPIGCYMGSFGEDWVEMFAKENQQYGLHRVSGYGDFVLANRVSYEMDLTGPSMVTRTACSSSLVALHEACIAVSRGDCEGAIVGGANLIMGPGMTAAMSEQGVLSPDGSCKSFSADANGYARGEAISAIFIKPLADAIRDGNPVRAVIRGTASNSDGRGTGGMQVPNDIAQEAMIRRAYSIAGIHDFSQTAFVECHGTGTSIGDPIETRAVGRVFGPHGGIQIGSVKPNLGHSEGASGLTSVIKSVLALEHGIIPPNIKFAEPNPDIPWESCKLSVPTEPMPWPQCRSERISVNSFGIGGSNAHIIMDSAKSFGIDAIQEQPLTSPQLLVFSAASAESVKKAVAVYKDFVLKNPGRVNDLSFTLANKREHLPHRAYAVVNLFGGVNASVPLKSGKPPSLVMVFTGQGAQWPEMGRCLMLDLSFPIFRQSIQGLDAHLKSIAPALTWSLEEELQKPAKTSRLGSAELSQPLCTAIQIALVDTLASVGVTASAVVGHSSGEIAAAYAAGAITATEAMTVAFFRGQVTKLQTKLGSMAAIGMGSDNVQQHLQPGVVVACENSPRSVTLSGDTEAVESVVASIQRAHPDILARKLKVDKAYHSPHMGEIGSCYRALIENISPKTPQKPFFSSVEDGLLRCDSHFGPEYWQKNLESPVKFRSAIATILQHEMASNMMFLEVGPHAALEGPLRQTQAEYSNSSPYASVLVRNQNDVESLLAAVGKLHSLNYPVDLSRVVTQGSTLPDLPRYPWDHTKAFWYESRLSHAWRHPQHKYHNLLGQKVAESTEFEVLFRNVFHLDHAPWMRDHKVGDDIVFPFAGYAEMIGEAIRQLTGVSEAFKLRNVVISTALVLKGNQPTEIMTTLRRHRLTDTLDSEWWEFTIASHNGNLWAKHCVGEARSHTEPMELAEESQPLVRKVTTRRCYDAMARAGLNYGPSFQRLDYIRSGTTQQIATSEVESRPTDDKDYHIHPSILDASLQLLSVAATKGYVNTTGNMMIPTSIQEICIFRCHEDIQIRASASYSPGGCILGSGECVQSDGKVVLRSSGIKLSGVDHQESLGTRDGFARAEWAPHIDFLDIPTLIKPSSDRSAHMRALAELSHLCMVHTKRTIAPLDTSLDHMHKFKSWVENQLLSTDLQSFEALNNSAIEHRVKRIVRELSHTPAAGPSMAIQKIFVNIDRIFTGEVQALDLLISDNTLTSLYASMDQCDESQFFAHLAHTKPNLRILEVGAGTGGSTENILKHLTAGNRTLYSKYTFTDISSGFFPAARERFATYSNIEYSTLDISKDPFDQGFTGRKYDLIIATNVLHATPSLNESLSNVRKLLETNGRLLLHELTPTSKWVNYIWGTLPGWWYGLDDGRVNEPYVGVARWNEELKAAGFRPPDATVLDSPEPYQLGAVIVARPAVAELPIKRVTLLALSRSNNVELMLQGLENRGYVVYLRGLHELPLPKDQDVIAMLDDEGPFFEDMDDERFHAFKSLVDGLNERGLLWVTGLSQIQCQDPQFAQINGAARSLRSEMLVDIATCEVDSVARSTGKIVDVFEQFQTREKDHILNPEFEYVVIDNTVHVGRFHSFLAQDELLTSDPSDSIALRTNKPGHLAALHWEFMEAEMLKDNDVEVEIHATGLNFKDVLGAMGIVENQENGFGLEAAGIVRRTGPHVRSLIPGDRVMLLSSCSFGSSTIISENVCEKIPGGLSFEDAATMPCVFATALYSIFDIGNLRRGQSILIHSACGGVGLAAIQLAQMIGAEIYTTVGNDDKVKFLMDTFGLARNRIFNSRSTSFVDSVMRETNGEGVDLALNSLSGELLHATWSCIAEFGKMVEISKRDLIGSGKLDMSPFLANRSYCCVDLDQICRKRSKIAKRLLKEIVHLVRERYIHPIRPIKIFTADVIVDAFRYMQQGVHLGKIVVSLRDTTGKVHVGETIQRRKKTSALDSSSSFLLVGGLGGLGRAVSTWMVERGARHFIYLSPSAGTKPEHREFADELSSMGCRADFVQGSVSSLKDVIKAVTRAEGRLKGILQMSMALGNQTFPRMTTGEWNTAVDPKVRGTWNLHHASVSAQADLDFFVLFSSISGICGQPGQTNYAGANTFMDAFSQYRLSLGLPACAIQIGAVEEVGFLAEHDDIKQKLKAAGALPAAISESELLQALDIAMQSTSSQSSSTTNNICLGLRTSIPLSDPQNRLLWKKDVRMAVFHNNEDPGAGSGTPVNDGLKAFILAAKADATFLTKEDAAHFLAVEIGKKVFSLLLKPEEDLMTWCSLPELGMDSLVAIEVRQWWKTIFEFDISVLEMLGMGTLDALGEHAVKGMLQSFHGAQG
ncbi:Acyl transferase/acyl hydrolase/lysophospholipase [Penicillium argentinense]|uniref:Acyl transferase/acyl hydrolase/lysophospholipase n=1 Tax=Penicillium argentinense TaxID=1131581 RepID=A0A9W9FQ29_9EURO|nr:Acyl transferase/acyl hydrolase/lysophospholipase [Penicillium argentinense]KAJ5104223.1 Acyl transferase/acyl hydrolase/lysophospholipase [Penicillium argentinense]